MLENFAKIRVYDPYYDFVAYFLPPFLVGLFGYFSHYPEIENAVLLILRFNIFFQIFIVLVFLTGTGKFLYELVSAILTFFQHAFYKLSVSFSNGPSAFEKTGKFFLSHMQKASGEAVPPQKIYTFLKEDPLLKDWYARTKMTAAAFQTGLGAVCIAFFAFQNDRILFLILLILLLFFVRRSRRLLTEAEVGIEAAFQKRK